MASSLSTRIRILVVAGLAGAGIVGGAAAWAPAAQAGCYGTPDAELVCEDDRVPAVVGNGGETVARVRALATRAAAQGIATLTGCGECTPGVVGPIGPPPIGPAGDDVRELLANVGDELPSRDVRRP